MTMLNFGNKPKTTVIVDTRTPSHGTTVVVSRQPTPSQVAVNAQPIPVPAAVIVRQTPFTGPAVIPPVPVVPVAVLATSPAPVVPTPKAVVVKRHHAPGLHAPHVVLKKNTHHMPHVAHSHHSSSFTPSFNASRSSGHPRGAVVVHHHSHGQTLPTNHGQGMQARRRSGPGNI